MISRRILDMGLLVLLCVNKGLWVNCGAPNDSERHSGPEGVRLPRPVRQPEEFFFTGGTRGLINEPFDVELFHEDEQVLDGDNSRRNKQRDDRDRRDRREREFPFFQDTASGNLDASRLRRHGLRQERFFAEQDANGVVAEQGTADMDHQIHAFRPRKERFFAEEDAGTAHQWGSSDASSMTSTHGGQDSLESDMHTDGSTLDRNRKKAREEGHKRLGTYYGAQDMSMYGVGGRSRERYTEPNQRRREHQRREGTGPIYGVFNDVDLPTLMDDSSHGGSHGGYKDERYGRSREEDNHPGTGAVHGWFNDEVDEDNWP